MKSKKNKKEKIDLEKLALILVELKLEKNSHPVKKFNRLAKDAETKNQKYAEKAFLEYLIFDLFTDNACFILAFGQDVSFKLFQVYYSNIIVQLMGEGYKIDCKNIDKLFEKRFIEYHNYLKEYDPKFIKKTNPNNYLPGLGKAFSLNFIGCKDPVVIYAVHLEFVRKIQFIYNKFLKELSEKYEIIPEGTKK